MELNGPKGSAANVSSVIYFLVDTVKDNYFNVLEYEQPILLIRMLYQVF